MLFEEDIEDGDQFGDARVDQLIYGLVIKFKAVKFMLKEDSE